MNPIALVFQSILALALAVWLIGKNYFVLNMIGYIIAFISIMAIWHVGQRVVMGAILLNKIKKEKSKTDND